MSFTPSAYIGRIAAFYPRPGCVVGCLPVAGVQRLTGEVIGAVEAAPARGLPSVTLTIRGRSGKTLAVDAVECYAQLFSTYHDAITNASTP